MDFVELGAGPEPPLKRSELILLDKVDPAILAEDKVDKALKRSNTIIQKSTALTGDQKSYLGKLFSKETLTQNSVWQATAGNNFVQSSTKILEGISSITEGDTVGGVVQIATVVVMAIPAPVGPALAAVLSVFSVFWSLFGGSGPAIEPKPNPSLAEIKGVVQEALKEFKLKEFMETSEVMSIQVNNALSKYNEYISGDKLVDDTFKRHAFEDMNTFCSGSTNSVSHYLLKLVQQAKKITIEDLREVGGDDGMFKGDKCECDNRYVHFITEDDKTAEGWKAECYTEAKKAKDARDMIAALLRTHRVLYMELSAFFAQILAASKHAPPKGTTGPEWLKYVTTLKLQAEIKDELAAKTKDCALDRHMEIVNGELSKMWEKPSDDGPWDNILYGKECVHLDGIKPFEWYPDAAWRGRNTRWPTSGYQQLHLDNLAYFKPEDYNYSISRKGGESWYDGEYAGVNFYPYSHTNQTHGDAKEFGSDLWGYKVYDGGLYGKGFSNFDPVAFKQRKALNQAIRRYYVSFNEFMKVHGEYVSSGESAAVQPKYIAAFEDYQKVLKALNAKYQPRGGYLKDNSKIQTAENMDILRATKSGEISYGHPFNGRDPNLPVCRHAMRRSYDTFWRDCEDYNGCLWCDAAHLQDLVANGDGRKYIPLGPKHEPYKDDEDYYVQVDNVAGSPASWTPAQYLMTWDDTCYWSKSAGEENWCWGGWASVHRGSKLVSTLCARCDYCATSECIDVVEKFANILTQKYDALGRSSIDAKKLAKEFA